MLRTRCVLFHDKERVASKGKGLTSNGLLVWLLSLSPKLIALILTSILDLSPLELYGYIICLSIGSACSSLFLAINNQAPEKRVILLSVFTFLFFIFLTWITSFIILFKIYVFFFDKLISLSHYLSFIYLFYLLCFDNRYIIIYFVTKALFGWLVCWWVFTLMI